MSERSRDTAAAASKRDKTATKPETAAAPKRNKTSARPGARKPAVKDYSKSKEFRTVREALMTKASAELGTLDPLQLDRIDEIMDLWCQRQMLRDDVRKRGPTVLDDRGRESENRCISLGLQVSKQILELYKALGFQTEPARETAGTRGAAPEPEEDDEDDEL